MEIRAYDESYVDSAQNILGHAVDFAVMTLNIEADSFGKALSVSTASKQFEIGNPKYVAGMTGCEFTREVLIETCTKHDDAEDVMYLDRSPEYWSGWALAFYQWYSKRSFMDILTIVPLSEIIKMYNIYHEQDIINFVEHMDKIIREKSEYTRLRIRRMNCGMSQSELANDSGVALRQIQLFEQKQRNINNASSVTLLRLSKSLNCRIEDLMEYS